MKSAVCSDLPTGPRPKPWRLSGRRLLRTARRSRQAAFIANRSCAKLAFRTYQQKGFAMSISDQRGGFTRRTLLQILTGLPATLTLPAAWAAAQIAGSVSELTGEATAELNKENRKLKISSALYLGDTLATGAQS